MWKYHSTGKPGLKSLIRQHLTMEKDLAVKDIHTEAPERPFRINRITGQKHYYGVQQ